MWDPSLPFEKKVQSDFASLLEGAAGNASRRTLVPGKEIFLLEGVLLEDECRRLIAEAEQPAFGFGRTDYNKKYRGNLRLIADDSGMAEALWLRMKHLVPAVVEEDGWQHEVVGLNECFRLSKYLAGDVFKQHCDASYQRTTDEKSMFTVNIYLNSIDEDFEGGHTRFFSRFRKDMECSVDPKAGAALIFRQPPHSCYYHDGERVEMGLKYLLRSDIMYRRTSRCGSGCGNDDRSEDKDEEEPVHIGTIATPAPVQEPPSSPSAAMGPLEEQQDCEKSFDSQL